MCQKKHGVGVRGDTIYYSESCLVSEEKCVHIVVDNNFQEVTFEVCFVRNSVKELLFLCVMSLKKRSNL